MIMPLDPLPLRENLAKLCHDQWTGWMQHLFSKLSEMPHGGWGLRFLDGERWLRQMDTPYAELTEAEKDSDRKEADRFLAILAAIPMTDATHAIRPLADIIRAALLEALSVTSGQQRMAAELLKITPRQMDYQMQKYGIPRARTGTVYKTPGRPRAIMAEKDTL